MHANRPVHAVVDDEDDHVEPVLDGRGQLGRAHHEVAVARDADGGPRRVEHLRRERRREPVAHRPRARGELRRKARELEVAVHPDREVAGAAGEHRIVGQPPAQERDHLAEVDAAGQRTAHEARLVVGAGSFRPAAPARGIEDAEPPQRGGELRQRRDDRQLRLVDAAELARVGMRVDERLARARRLQQRVAAGRHLAEPAAEREDQVGLLDVTCELRVHPEREMPRVDVGAVVDVVLAAERRGDRDPVLPRRRRARPRPSPRVQPPSPTIASGRSEPRQQVAEPGQVVLSRGGTGDVRRSAVLRIGLLEEHVLREREHDRSRADRRAAAEKARATSSGSRSAASASTASLARPSPPNACG